MPSQTFREKSDTNTTKDEQHMDVTDKDDTIDKEFAPHTSFMTYTLQKSKFECEEYVRNEQC